jgi:hypothetical protein
MPPVSKIAQLPEDLRLWLHQTFVQRAFGDIAGVTEELNQLMKEAGVAISIGKSAVGAESLRVKRAQEAIKATTEAAKLIADSSADPGDNRSAAAMAIVQAEVFELLLKIRESEEEQDPLVRLGVMNEAALGLSRLSRARVNQAKWADELDVRAKAAADKVSKLAKKGGMDAKTVAEIRANILGIVKREPAQQVAS